MPLATLKHMKIAIVGPVHPYKGGVPQHTTELAHRLRAFGHDVTVLSWKNQYPFFYPGEQFVPDDKPEMPLFGNTRRVLSWKNPLGWWREARKLRRYDEIIFAWWVPVIQGPVILAMMRTLGKHGPRKVIICHNVVGHNSSKLGVLLSKLVFARANMLIVHSDSQAEDARELTKTRVKVVKLPAHLPGKAPTKPHTRQVQHHLLFFGLVREYKGVDVLLHALAQVPDITVTIAGEIWGKQQSALERLIRDLKLEQHVILRSGYVPADEIDSLFASADAQVLPYRAATGSQMVDLAFSEGIPVIASRTGSLAMQVREGVDGLLCEPGDVASLAAAIKHFYEPGVAARLQNNIPSDSSNDDWQKYVTGLISDI